MRILEYISFTSDSLGIITCFISAVTYFGVRKLASRLKKAGEVIESKNMKETFKMHKGVQSVKPIALCLSLMSNSLSIKTDVKYYLDETDMKMEIEELIFTGLTQDNFDQFAKELQKKKLCLQAKGFTELHVFMAGPLQAAFLFGAIYCNWIPVKIYNQNQSTRKYEYWGILAKNI